MEQISPTRMNMLAKKSQIKLAKQGVDLLKKKRDALVKEFFDTVSKLMDSRKKLDEISHHAYRSLMISKAIDGERNLASAAVAVSRDVSVSMTEKSIWGVKVPVLSYDDVRRDFLERGYSPTGVSSRVDIVAEKFEEILDLLMKIASVEVHLKRLGAEIKKTSRRVNALEENLIPNLNYQVRFIRGVLEERAREDTFRLKRIKKKSEKEAWEKKKLKAAAAV